MELEADWHGGVAAAAGGVDERWSLVSTPDGSEAKHEDAVKDGDEVRVSLFHFEAGSNVCCGMIGRDDKRFCTRVSCLVQSHARKAKVVADHVYIRGPKGPVAYLKPSLPMANLGLCRQDALSLTMEIAEWNCWFASVRSASISSFPDFDD